MGETPLQQALRVQEQLLVWDSWLVYPRQVQLASLPVWAGRDLC